MYPSNPKNKPTQSALLLGGFLAVAGVLYLLKEFNLIKLSIEFWPLLLIAIGVMSGLKKGFSRPTPLILITMGVLFLIPEFKIAGVSSEDLVGPVLLILSGLYIIFRSRRKDAILEAERRKFESQPQNVIFSEESSTITVSTAQTDSYINIESYFGGRKEIITSKQFKGCTATAICGGAEINLMQADSIQQPMVIDLRVILGGIEIIVPSHWEIINEVDVLFGGIEDKRNLRTSSEFGDGKKLLLRGSVSFGGLELKSY